MSTLDIIGLYTGAQLLDEKVQQLVTLTKHYRALAYDFDRLVGFKEGKVASIEIMVRGKRGNVGGASTTINVSNANLETYLDMLIEEQRKACEDAYKKIMELKETIG